MRRFTAAMVVAFAAADYGIAGAMTSHQYELLGESLYFVFALVGLVFALAIFRALKEGSLGKPWLLIVSGLAAAVVGSAIEILDLLEIVIHRYDMRPALLVFRTGSILLLLVGLFLYKRDLQ